MSDVRRALASAGYGATISGLDASSSALESLAGPGLLWLDRSRFAGADLRQATLDGWHFKLCDLTGANLRGASLRGASFAGCDLTGADLRDTDLTDARFEPVGAGRGAIATRLDRAMVDPGVKLSPPGS
ncbi:pentapeptide repeat-containing protein [Demequina muriae]|uniref:pentapeptide repeat-containing protein n=1 Tax=Demequina muriae TaxID=3051664 RepID=UPI00345E37F5